MRSKVTLGYSHRRPAPPDDLLFPSTAETNVKLDEREPLDQLCLREIELCRECIVLAGEHLEVTGSPMPIEDFRESVGVLRCE